MLVFPRYFMDPDTTLRESGSTATTPSTRTNLRRGRISSAGCNHSVAKTFVIVGCGGEKETWYCTYLLLFLLCTFGFSQPITNKLHGRSGKTETLQK